MSVWLLIWTILLFASLAWYAFLLFYVGYKGGCEIQELTRTLSRTAGSSSGTQTGDKNRNR